MNRAGSLKLQPRDDSLLRGLFESRVMTTDHAAALYFDGSYESAKKRLHKLKNAGHIGERKRHVTEPSILFLTRKGFEVLRGRGKLADYPRLQSSALDRRADVSDLTLKHELEIMDVKAAFHSAIRSTNQFSIDEFSTWPLLYQFATLRPGHSGTEVTVKPDGHIRIREKEASTKGFVHEFFLEVDRSNETQDTLVAKAACYREYYRSGDFAVRNGATRDQRETFPFQVLMVFKSAERRNNTAERLLQSSPPILTMAMLSTMPEVIVNPLAPIWLTPADYRDATKGTRFDPEHRQGKWNYRTETERERFVEECIGKIRLLRD